MIIHKEYNQISDVLPSLYVNFDEEELTSCYPEPASYENFVPCNWIGKYDDFINDIP